MVTLSLRVKQVESYQKEADTREESVLCTYSFITNQRNSSNSYLPANRKSQSKFNRLNL